MAFRSVKASLRDKKKIDLIGLDLSTEKERIERRSEGTPFIISERTDVSVP